MIDLFDDFYRNKIVLITGHTGFKGSWLSIWLHALGAQVVGVALNPYTERDNFVLSRIGNKISADIRADIRDGLTLDSIFATYQPEIVFHLAAQPIVRRSYEIPVETYETNLMGTIHIMEAIRKTRSVKVGVMVTTDKCYENRETMRGYVESDPLGGYDPYSSSKGACEIAISSWRRSFFNPENYGFTHTLSLSSVRAGNVIGGGDWAPDRIIPDCIRAIETDVPVDIRAPKSVRPWEHVLEPLSGYLLLAKRQYEDPIAFAESWNFGPEQNAVLSVWDMAGEVIGKYGKGELRDVSSTNALHEAQLLLLNIDKAKSMLGWHPRMNAHSSVDFVVDWYKRYRDEDVYEICLEQIERFAGL
ncbi:MAG: CDP-glucose 4,6-dehydratase [Bacteroidaceae bacterium]|nr:CDP-glucose 4,6-dehydratase [Bacteroidaceae bacterium]